jgi:hypothetical protein
VLAVKSSPHVQSAAEREAVEAQIRQESTLSPGQADMTIPPFGLKRVEADMEKMRSVDDSNGESFTIALSDPIYASYSLSEKFTYNMIHAEGYSQMCEMLPERPDEIGRIYGQLRGFFGEYLWSERQSSFFSANRDSVQLLMQEVIGQNGGVGMNFLSVIVAINAREMIPYLIDTYNKNNRNHYILTTLMLLMQNNKYTEFMQSSSYNKLYNRGTDTYSAFLIYNKANEDLIIKRATNFFNGSSQQ